MQHQHIEDRRCKDEAVKPVKHAAVPWQQAAVVCDIILAFYERKRQVSQLGHQIAAHAV